MAVIPAAVGPLMVALGSMGAIGAGPPLSYQQTANFTFNGDGGGTFLLDFLTSASFATGCDSAALNGNLLINSRSFQTPRGRTH